MYFKTLILCSPCLTDELMSMANAKNQLVNRNISKAKLLIFACFKNLKFFTKWIQYTNLK